MGVASVALEARTVCHGCGQLVALNGAFESVECARCSTVIDTPPGFWVELLREPIAEAVNLRESTFYVVKMSLMEYGLSVKLRYGRKLPRCPEPCKTELDEDDLEQAAGSPTPELTCHRCNASIPARPTPEWFLDVNPHVTLLVGESTEQADTPTRWHAVVGLGEAIGLLPEGVKAFCDATPTVDGNVAVAWHAEPEEGQTRAPRLALANRQGMLLWSQTRLDFSRHARLFTSPPDGRIILIDPDEGFVLVFDQQNGELLDSITAAAGGVELDVTGARAFCVDQDGTYLVDKRWEPTELPRLRRFTPEGLPASLWPGMSPYAAERDVHEMRWDAPSDHPEALPEGSLFTVGWDGFFYVSDRVGRRVAKYSERGELIQIMRNQNQVIESVRAIGADSSSNVYLLFRHTTPLAGSRWPHVARITPEGRFELWLGPQAPTNRAHIGAKASGMKVDAQGALTIAGGVRSLRTLGPDGRSVWRSPRTVREDRHVQSHLDSTALDF